MWICGGGEETVSDKESTRKYRATRQSPPDDFHPQEQRILQIVRDIGIPIFFKPGFEADDQLATIAKRLFNYDFETFLVSRDKDLRQAVDQCSKRDQQHDEQAVQRARVPEHGT